MARFLKGATHVFMLEMAHSMNAIVFAPSDYVPRGYLYVVQKGDCSSLFPSVCGSSMRLQSFYLPMFTGCLTSFPRAHSGSALYGVRVMFKGSVWGEDMLVANPKLRLPMVARAMNYLAVNYISRWLFAATPAHKVGMLGRSYHLFHAGFKFLRLPRDILM